MLVEPLKRIIFRPAASGLAWMISKSPFLLKKLKQCSFWGKSSIVYRLNLRGVSIENVEGIKFRLDLSDQIHREIAYNNFEINDLHKVMQLIRPGDICLDIGSNIGVYALFMAKACSPSGKVYAFEACPPIYEQLAQNASLNPGLPVVHVHKAIARSKGVLPFYAPIDENSGSGSTIAMPHLTEGNKPVISVKSIDIDTFLRENNIDFVQLVKIDIEGGEKGFIEGAKKSLSNHVFSHILIEFNEITSKAGGLGFEELILSLTSHGYVLAPSACVDAYRAGKLRGEKAVFNLFFSKPKAYVPVSNKELG
jgi:FkbM family methyltransferase